MEVKHKSMGLIMDSSSDKVFHQEQKNLYWPGLTDVQIWKAYKAGNTDALIYIYKTYHQPLYNYGMQFYFNHELVKDCIQETFFYLQNKSKNLSDIESIKYYLFKILRRKLRVSKEQEKKYHSDQNLYLEKFGIEVSTELKLIDSHLDEERRRYLKSALEKLPERQKESILLFYFEGFTHGEIAQIMKLKADKYSRKLVYRAISTLKKHMLSLLMLMFCRLTP